VQFGKPDAGLGNARTATLPGDGLHESAEPVVRPYWLLDNIEAAIAAAVNALMKRLGVPESASSWSPGRCR
jgi:hypothetical protein